MRTPIIMTLAALATACAHQDTTPDASALSATDNRKGVTNPMPGTPAAGDMDKSGPSYKSGSDYPSGNYDNGNPKAAPGSEGTPMQEPPLPPAPPNDTFTPAPNAQLPSTRSPGEKPIVAEEHPYAAPKAGTGPTGAANGGITATTQSNAEADIKLVGAIRRAISSDSQLSFAAKNVTVVTNNGNVYLRGTVKTAKERDRIETIASSQPGVGNVDNRLTVQP